MNEREAFASPVEDNEKCISNSIRFIATRKREATGIWRQLAESAGDRWRLLTKKNRDGIVPKTIKFGSAKRKNGLGEQCLKLKGNG